MVPRTASEVSRGLLVYIQWVLLRRGSAYAPGLRDAESTSLLQQEAAVRGETV